VFSLSTVIITAFFFLLCGAALGGFVLHLFRSNVYSRELEQRLHETETQLRNYQRDVADTFTETSQHLHRMTQSYRDMNEHLISSALKLTTPEISRSLLEAAGHLAENKNSPRSIQHIEPPRDWAPKPVGAKGTLREDYGLRDDEHAPMRPTEIAEDFDFDGAAKRY